MIGAGPGGYVAAIRAAQLGLKVACVEKRADARRHLPQRRLHPSKALLHASRAYDEAQPRALRQHGIKVGASKLDLAAMLARKDEGREGLTSTGVADPVQEEQDRRLPRHGHHPGRRARSASRSTAATSSGSRPRASSSPPAASRPSCPASPSTSARSSPPPTR